MQVRNKSNELKTALDYLFSLRDKWDFYISALPKLEKQYASLLGNNLDDAAKLWLADICCKTHNYSNQTLIIGRKTTKKYPQIERQQLSKEVLSHLEKV